MDATLLTTEDTLRALDVPWSEALARSADCIAGHDIGYHASRLLTAGMARDLWLLWNPQQARRLEDSSFLECFRNFLTDGLELGYRLGRFREVSARLPHPDAGARNWIPFFEETVGGQDCCTLRMFLSRAQYQAFQASNQQRSDVEPWDQLLSMMTDGLFYELGLVFRPPTIQVDDALSTPWFRCEWNDLRLPAQRGVNDQSVLVNDTVERLRLLNIEGEPAVNPANGSECAIIDKSYQAIAEQAGLSTWDSRGYAVLALSAAIRRAAAALVNRSLYELYFLRLRDFSPDLVSSLQGAIEPDFVVQVLRGLLAEEISVRDLSLILQAILMLRSIVNVDSGEYISFAPPTGGMFLDLYRKHPSQLLPADYVEFVRWSLKRYISHKYTRGQNTLIVYLMAQDAEKLLARPDQLDFGAVVAILQAVRDEVGSLPPTTQTPVILTASTVRRRLQRLVSTEFPRLAVLSYQELSPDMNIQPIARITPKFQSVVGSS